MNIRVFWYAVLLLGVCRLSAASYSYGDWNWEVSDYSGSVSKLCYQGELIVSSFYFGLQTEQKLVNHFTGKAVSLKGNVLTLTHREAPWTIRQIFTFDASGRKGLLERTYEFVLDAGESKERKFKDIVSLSYFTAEGEYYIPAVPLGYGGPGDERASQPPRDRFLKDAAGWKGSIASLGKREIIMRPDFFTTTMLRTPRGTTLILTPDDRRDFISPRFKLNKTGKLLEYNSRIATCGWAFPGVPQKNFSREYLYVLPKTTFAEALESKMADFFLAKGLMAPKDRPDWVEKAVVYEYDAVRPGGLLKRDAQTLLPRLRKMGFTVLYIMPVQEGTGPYNPCWFTRLHPNVASSIEELRDFVRAAHRNGIKVWLDIVPHGGTADMFRYSGRSAFWMFFSEDNRVWGYAADYCNPHYQAFIADAARFWMEKCEIDGFRIDQPYGSAPNWRKKGFPANAAKMINAEWFRKSLAEAGGVAPALEYDRAGLSRREGGYQMVEKIREAVRSVKPDGSVLAEVLPALRTTNADLIYDLVEPLFGGSLQLMDSAVFGEYLNRYFYEKSKISPPGARFLRVVKSHDTDYTFDLIGPGLGKALLAACTLSHGSPMIHGNMDVGYGTFIERLLKLRQQRIELSQGEIDYRAVRCDIPGIYRVLLRKDEAFSIGLVNFTNQTRRGTVTVDPVGHDISGNMVEMLSREQSVKASQLASFPVTIRPYETLVFCSAPEIPKRKFDEQPESPETGDVKIIEDQNNFTIKSSRYTAVLSKANGLPVSFGAGSGNPVMAPADLLLARRQSIPATVTWNRRKNVLTAKVSVGAGSFLFRYQCEPEKLHVSAAMEQVACGEYAALFLPVAETAGCRWKINTLQGMFDDFILQPEPASSLFPLQEASPSRARRDRNITLLWASDHLPVAPGNPYGGFYNKSGNGFEVRLQNGLLNAPALWSYQKWAGNDRKAGMMLYFRGPGIVSADASESFEFTLSPAKYHSRDLYELASWTAPNGIKLIPESSALRVQHPNYSMRLVAAGGGLLELKNQNGDTLLTDQRLRARSGSDKTIFDNLHDVNSNCSIRMIGDTLQLRFLSMLYSARRSTPGESATVFGMTTYHLNGSGTIRMRCEFFTDSMTFARGGALRLFWEGKVPATLDDGKMKFSIAPQKQADQLSIPVVSEKTLFFPGRSYAVECTFETGSGDAPLKFETAWFDDYVRRSRPDLSFETGAAAWSVRDGQMVQNFIMEQFPFITVSGTAWYLNQFYTTADAADGMVSVLLRGARARFKEFPHAGPHLFFSLGKALNAGSHQLRVKVKTAGMQPGGALKFRLEGLDDQGRRIPYVTRSVPVPENSDWTETVIEFSLNKNIHWPLGTLIQDEWSDGLMWVDHIRLDAGKK